ncbi:S8 family serine peptidase [Chlorogloeopsis fritschii]|uniref:S8 family serine peptidase n=1 Tax=Chlorogloeopsis fritschii TaxID=1124 RepID=UPI0023F3CEBE|nr:S8 family serine peptidase [Chlorogloeopsis fritschii]
MNNHRNDLFDTKGLNITSTSSINNLTAKDDDIFSVNSRSSFKPAENALEEEVNIQGRKNRKSKKASLSAAKADLVIQNASAPSVAVAGSTIQLTYQVKNKGKSSAGFNYTDCYLSKDKTLTSDDNLLGWNWIGGLEPGSATSQSYNVTVDENTTPGTYYLLYRADALDNILEINNSNNIAAREITITGKNKETQGYNPTSGYGLVNAAEAVARAARKNTFADVPNRGGNDWGADLVKAPEAWANGYTGQGVVVAVLDTGVDYNHADLKNNIWTNSKEIPGNGQDDDGNGFVDDVYGWNFDGNNNNTLDGNGHGTHVSGSIAGENNGFGVTGVAHGAKIMPVKVLNDDGSGYYSSIADGIYYAVNNGANVINLSLGGEYPNGTLQKAIEYASSKNVIVVMAAGNDGKSLPGYPARYADNWGVAVGAVDKNKNMADFSNRAGQNPLAYVTAPGVKVYSTLPGNQYASYSGTSMAAPHVAGVVALMLSANSNLTDAQVRQILAETSGNSTQSTALSGENNITSFSHNNSLTTAISNFNVSSFSSNNTTTWSHSNTTSSDVGAIASQTSTSSTNGNQDGMFLNSPTWLEFWNDYKTSVASSSNISTNGDEVENIVGKRKALLEAV